jgi:hypothetical protein
MNVNPEAGNLAGTTDRFGRYQSLWGSFEANDPVSARRTGMKRYHLEVFPPGTNAIERGQLRRFRQWRVWGALIALTLDFIIASTSRGWQAPLFIAVVYLVGLVIGLQLTRRVRHAVRNVYVATIRLNGSTVVEGDIALLESCLSEFESLDRERRAATIAPVEYEAQWARLYARLTPAV